MFDPFELIFVQRGVLEIAALSIAAGLIGTWIVLRGIAFYAHAVGTASFPGLVLAEGLGFSAHLGAGGTALAVAGSVGWLARRDRSRYDSVTALVLVGALALGVILASDVFHSGASVETLLFGSVLVISAADIWFAAAVSAIVLIGSLVLEQRWLATGFDPDAARALGARSVLPDLILLGLVALVAIAALSAVGALLATALLVVPAATTRLLVLAAAHVAAGDRRCSCCSRASPACGLPCSSTRPRARRSPCSARSSSRSWRALASPGAGAAWQSPPRRRCCSRWRAQAADRRTRTRAAVAAARRTRSASSRRRPSSATSCATSAATASTSRRSSSPTAIPTSTSRARATCSETAGAKLVFASGDGLDEWIGDVVSQSGGDPTVLDLGDAVGVRLAGESSGPEASRFDPHWWHDPRNVERAIAVIRDALVKANPSARARYDARRCPLPASRAQARRRSARVLRRRAALAAQARHRPRRVQLLRQPLRHRRDRRRDPVADDRRRRRRRATSRSSAR